MKIEKSINLHYTTAEFAGIMSAYESIGETIKEIEKINPKATEIIAEDTGEVIGIDDLRRVRGVLDGLTNGGHWNFIE